MIDETLDETITFKEINNLIKKYPNDPFLRDVKKDMKRASFFKKLSSYQKLKKKGDNLFRLYHRAMKKLNKLGQGMEGDDIILGFEEKLK